MFECDFKYHLKNINCYDFLQALWGKAARKYYDLLHKQDISHRAFKVSDVHRSYDFEIKTLSVLI